MIQMTFQIEHYSSPRRCVLHSCPLFNNLKQDTALSTVMTIRNISINLPNISVSGNYLDVWGSLKYKIIIYNIIAVATKLYVVETSCLALNLSLPFFTLVERVCIRGTRNRRLERQKGRSKTITGKLLPATKPSHSSNEIKKSLQATRGNIRFSCWKHVAHLTSGNFQWREWRVCGVKCNKI